jgi:CRISPR/Cas system CSM-associated protein Csm3 (group 7 of RAMP superfamily)
MQKIKIPQAYEFVPLPPRAVVETRPEARLDRRVANTLSGVLRFELELEQPLHIGSGSKELRDGKVVRTFVRSGGKPVIPGSSLRGALRSRYEAITPSCVQSTKLAPKRGDWINTVRSTTGFKDARLPAQNVPEPLRSNCNLKASCPACGLFGCTDDRKGLRSRLTVHDSQLLAGQLELVPFAEQFEPNLHHLGPGKEEHGSSGRYVLTGVHGRKFAVSNSSQRVNGFKLEPQDAKHLSTGPAEVLRAGSKLQGCLQFVNLRPAELGGLLCALGLAPESRLKLGAAKASAFGRVRVRLLEATLSDAERRPVAFELESLRQRFLESTLRFEAGEVRLVSFHGKDC